MRGRERQKRHRPQGDGGSSVKTTSSRSEMSSGSVSPAATGWFTSWAAIAAVTCLVAASPAAFHSTGSAA
jgi:hypothetical protein